MIRRGSALFPAALVLLALPRPATAGVGPTGQAFVPVPGCRAVDTRGPAGPDGGPALAAGETRILTLTGACGVPTSALGLAVNITAVEPAAEGFAELYAGDARYGSRDLRPELQRRPDTGEQRDGRTRFRRLRHGQARKRLYRRDGLRHRRHGVLDPGLYGHDHGQQPRDGIRHGRRAVQPDVHLLAAAPGR